MDALFDIKYKKLFLTICIVKNRKEKHFTNFIISKYFQINLRNVDVAEKSKA